MILRKLTAAGVLLAACGGVHAAAQNPHPATIGLGGLAESSEYFFAAPVQPPPSFMDVLDQAWPGQAWPISTNQPATGQQLKIISADFSPSSQHKAAVGLAVPAAAPAHSIMTVAGAAAGGNANIAAEGPSQSGRQNTLQRPTLFALPSVPEPSVWTLLCCGLAVAAFIAWRKSSYVA